MGNSPITEALCHAKKQPWVRRRVRGPSTVKRGVDDGRLAGVRSIRRGTVGRACQACQARRCIITVRRLDSPVDRRFQSLIPVSRSASRRICSSTPSLGSRPRRAVSRSRVDMALCSRSEPRRRCRCRPVGRSERDEVDSRAPLQRCTHDRRRRMLCDTVKVLTPRWWRGQLYVVGRPTGNQVDVKVVFKINPLNNGISVITERTNRVARGGSGGSRTPPLR